jgi:hypothetical protein
MLVRSLSTYYCRTLCKSFRHQYHVKRSSFGSLFIGCDLPLFAKNNSGLQSIITNYSHGGNLWFISRNYHSSADIFDQTKANTSLDDKFDGKEQKSVNVDDGDDDDKKLHDQRLSRFDKAKYLLKKYGLLFVGIELTLYTSSFLLFYFLIKCGVDMKPLLDFLHLNADSEVPVWLFCAGQIIDLKYTVDRARDLRTYILQIIQKGSTLMIVFAINKLLAPIRLPVAFALTPIVARRLKRWGLWAPKTQSSSQSK